MEVKQTFDEIVTIRDCEKGIDSPYCVRDMGRARGISGTANDFVVFPVGKGSMGYSWVMLRCVPAILCSIHLPLEAIAPKTSSGYNIFMCAARAPA